MKVLYCSHTADLKGSAISLYQLMSGMDGKEFSPVAAFSKKGILVEKLNAEGIPAYVLNRRGFLGFGLIYEAVGLIKREGIGLVHLNSAVPFCKYIALAARLKGIPVVWHIREDPEGKRVKALGKWINLLSDRVLVVSSDLEKYFRPGGKVKKIYNGVNTGIFHPRVDGSGFRKKYGIPQDAFVFGMVGTIEQRKGNLHFLTAAEKLAEKYGRAWFVVVGGPGDPDYIEQMRRFIGQNPALLAKTVMTGKLTDIPEVMAGFDVLVMPSLWEGFSRALIEAMASGCPAIASSVGETPHILEDGVNGFLVPPDEGQPLLDAMIKCMVMGNDISVFGARARERSLDFTIDRHVAEVCEVYRTIVR